MITGKRIAALCLMAFAIMHLLALVIHMAKFQIVKPLSLVLGPSFMILGIWLYRSGGSKAS
jgi:putative Ca2+/H+ antiporter (TMEM165/GDT1 family)